ncbi:hypothetical protein FPV67DRAFT_587665 [Lyophyllum atratum]|nr:hypothetical protein FPV67DRAFT_587665 [Lyophyllum atratum]
MPFPFTFSLSVPGLSNPFAMAPPAPDVDIDRPRQAAGKHDHNKKKLPITRRRPSPVPSPSVPLSRKRGWEPTFAEPSRSTTTLTLTSGYLDTPAKYREMASQQADNYHEVEMFASVSDTELPPPAKRRRGLAGQIVSTAVSAALIGTAVGLTVYRLWRDRGKESARLEGQHYQQPPPPPYQQGEWTPSAAAAAASPAPPLQVTPATPRSRRTRHPVSTSASKRPTLTHRRTLPRTRRTPPPTQPTFFPPAQPEFNFALQETGEPAEVEDQMDWIGDKLSMLIEEGKRALGREVVVMSDAKEDEVDDGSGAWEEESRPARASASVSRSGSMRRSKRPRSLAPSAHAFHSPSASPHAPGFALTSSSSASMVTPQRTHSTSRGGSADIGAGLGFTSSVSFQEDARGWESPEMRESMERARARFLRNRE